MPATNTRGEMGGEHPNHQKRLAHAFNVFWYRKVWFFAAFAGVLVVTALLIVYLPRSYRSSTLILIEEQRVQKEFIQSTVSESLAGRMATIRQQILSRFFLQKVIDQLGLYKNAKGTRDEILEAMRKHVYVEVAGRERNVDSFSIGFISSDPKTAMDVANRLAALFIEENVKTREKLVEGTTTLIDSQLQGLKEKLEVQESEVNRYKAGHTGELPEQLDANLRALDRLRVELAGLQATMQPLMLKQQEQKSQLANLQKTHQRTHPDLVALEREIQEFEQGKTPIGQELIRLANRQRQLEREIQTYALRVENAPKREQELAVLLRDYENTKRNYQAVLDKRLNAQISENLEKKQMGQQFRILDPAPLPDAPYTPNSMKLGLGGLLLGLIGGIALVCVRENFDSSVQMPEDLASLLAIPFLSVILDHRAKRNRLLPGGPASNGKISKQRPALPDKPFLSIHTASGSPHPRGHVPATAPPFPTVSSGLVSLTDPESPLTEQYRLLFLKLHHASRERKINVIAVTSSVQGEGKTTTICNLAIVAARDFGKKSLLIDADFKNPSVGRYFHTEGASGLIDVVQRRCSVEQAMAPAPVANLTILPMGRNVGARPNEITNIERLDDLLLRLRGKYETLLWNDAGGGGGGFSPGRSEPEPFEYIWIDAPPLVPVFDMTLISDAVEGVLFVVGAGEAPRHIITQAAKQLDPSKTLGTVLNRARLPWMASAYEYGYYGYSAYVTPQK